MAITRLIFYPNKIKKSKKSGKIPIYLRTLHNGVKAETRLNVEITEQELLLWDDFTMNFKERTNRVNDRIRSIQNGFMQLEAKNNFILGYLSPNQIIDQLLGRNMPVEIEKTSFSTYVMTYFNNHIVHNKAYAYNTVKTYRKA